jgi:uncharacterized protein
VRLERPADLFDRTREWENFAEFAQSTTRGLRLAVVSGRRRQGKSYLLRRLVRATGGLYHQAHEVERTQALTRFGDGVALALGLRPGTLRFDDWETALRTALGYPARGGPASTGASPAGPLRLLVIDELPYLLTHSPELPSVLQDLHDEARDADHPGAAVIVCGSALSVMTELLSGARPLRGRAQIDLTVRPFDYVQAREYWGIADPEVAFQVDAILGGTAGYKPLIEAAVPQRAAGLPKWLAGSVLNPAHALFNETDYLLREDPRISDKQLYNSILSAVAEGAHSPREIGVVVGRDTNHLRHPLRVLEDAGFLTRTDDVLTQKRPTYFLADPVIRFGEVVVEPHRSLLEERDTTTAWQSALPGYQSQILGPHFEHLARLWTAHHAGDLWPEPVGEVGPTVVNDRAGRAQHEVDVVALARGQRRAATHPRIVVLGEAKASGRALTLGDLQRLEHIRDLLVARGRDAATAHLALFGRSGFDRNLLAHAAERAHLHLITLDDLYQQTPGLGSAWR